MCLTAGQSTKEEWVQARASSTRAFSAWVGLAPWGTAVQTVGWRQARLVFLKHNVSPSGRFSTILRTEGAILYSCSVRWYFQN